MLGLGLGVTASPPSTLARYSLGGLAPAWISDFASGIYAANGQRSAFGNMHDFERLSAAWKRDALGDWTHVPAGDPRTGHHIWEGGKPVPAGIALEADERTNRRDGSAGLGELNIAHGSVVTGNSQTIGGVYLEEVDMGDRGQIWIPSAATESSIMGFFAKGTAGEVIKCGVYHGSPPAFTFFEHVFTGGLDFIQSAAHEDVNAITPVDHRAAPANAARQFYFGGLQHHVASVISTPILGMGSGVSVAGDSLSMKSVPLSDAIGGAMPEAVTLLLEGHVTYADEGLATQVSLLEWGNDPANMAKLWIGTESADTGRISASQALAGTVSLVESGPDLLSPGQDIPFAIAATFSSSCVHLVANGLDLGSSAALGLADLPAEPLRLAAQGNVSVSRALFWAGALADMPPTAALMEATS